MDRALGDVPIALVVCAHAGCQRRVRTAPSGQPLVERTSTRVRGEIMARATTVGQAGLQGWREKLADGVAGPVSEKTPLGEDQVRALIGVTFFALSVLYVVKTIQAVMQR